MSSTTRFVMGCLAFVVAASLAHPTLAQQQLGAIQGTIVDQSKAVMPGVTVTVTNLDTGLVRTTISNETGVYRVTSLDPGRYKVTAELQGFRSAAQNEVVLSVGATLGVNFNLAPGTINESIEVRGVTPDVQTEKADISAVVEQKKINDLPLVGRNVLSLAALQPGINGIGTSADFLTARTGHGRHRQRRARDRQQRQHRRRQHQQRPVGRHGPDRAERRGGAGVPGHRQQPLGRVRPQRGRDGQRHHQGRDQQLQRQHLRVPSEPGPSRARLLREPGRCRSPTSDRNDFGGSFGGPIRRDNSFFFFSTEIVREVTGNSA